VICFRRDAELYFCAAERLRLRAPCADADFIFLRRTPISAVFTHSILRYCLRQFSLPEPSFDIFFSPPIYIVSTQITLIFMPPLDEPCLTMMPAYGFCHFSSSFRQLPMQPHCLHAAMRRDAEPPRSLPHSRERQAMSIRHFMPLPTLPYRQIAHYFPCRLRFIHDYSDFHISIDY